MLVFSGCVRTHSDAIVSGRITTGNDRPVAHALITLIDPGTNASIGAEADGSGNYVLPPVSPGRRSLIVQKDGFQTSVQTNLEVPASGPLHVDVRMVPRAAEGSHSGALPGPPPVR